MGINRWESLWLLQYNPFSLSGTIISPWYDRNKQQNVWFGFFSFFPSFIILNLSFKQSFCPKDSFSPFGFPSAMPHILLFFLVPSACFSRDCWFSSLLIGFLRFWDCFSENYGCQDLLPGFIVSTPSYQLPLNTYYHLTALIYLKRQWLLHTVISVTVSKSNSSSLPSSYNM